MWTLLVVQHVPHERLGTFEPAFEAAGCSLKTVRADDPKAVWPSLVLAEIDGIVSMGGPQSVYEQAFRYRENVYGLQFHLEVTEPIIRAWMRAPGNRAELKRLRGIVDPLTIRRQSPQHVGRLQDLSHHVASTFCSLLKAPSRRIAHARV